VNPTELEFTAVRSQGAGGQNVNKVSSAAHLRFDVAASSLDDDLKAKLLNWPDQRISAQGVVVIKAQTHRSLPANRAEALRRLQDLLDLAFKPITDRLPTRPTRASKRKRLRTKALRASKKLGRQSATGADE
jgi:ribosome-associated protein